MMNSCRVLVALLLAVAATVVVVVVDASMIVSESRTRLPMSLSTVISDLEAEGMTELSTACVIVSRSVTAAQKQAVLDQILGGPDDHLSALSKAVATEKGLALALPSHSLLEEVVQSTVACQGLVIFVPSMTDLKRGEGLLQVLAPAMERLLQWQASQRRQQQQSSSSSTQSLDQHKACLVVVCEPGQEATTQQLLETAAAPILQTLMDGSIQRLEDVFDGSVLYLTPDKVEPAILNHELRPQQTVTPENAMALVANVVAEDGNLFAPLTALATSSTTQRIRECPQELAAARQLEPVKRKAVQAAVQILQETTQANTKLVPAFGALCDAVLQQAKDQFASSTTAAQKKTLVGKDLARSLQQDLTCEYMMDAYEVQLQLLSEASFASFREGLSKLRLTPTLAMDMEQIVRDTMKEFGAAVHKLIPKAAAASSVWKSRAKDTQGALHRSLSTFCRDRLLAAQADGRFRPIPRKGVTIGMHWLLPKPFGNDYRQEPWMVHAKDNLVYVPRRSTKVTDVPHEDVTGAGDWRDQVVPSPAGRDMIFMQ